MLQKLIYPILIFSLLILYPFLPERMDKGMMTMLLGAAVVVLVLFFIHKEDLFRLRRHYLKHSILFLIGYVIVHFQYPLDFVLGNVPEDNLFIWVNRTIVVKSLFFSTIGLISFLWGYALFRTNKKAVVSRLITTDSPVPTNLLVWLAAGLLVLYFFTVDPLYLIGHYGSVGMGATATYVILLFQVVIFGVLIQNIRNMKLAKIRPASFPEYVHRQGYFLLTLIIIYLLSVMLSGDRGPIITFSIAYVSGFYFVSRKKLSLTNAAVLFLVAAFIITILGITRSLDKNMSFTERVKEAVTQSELGDPSVLPQTTELAGSIRTLHTVVDYVPDFHPHTLGRFQLQQLVSSIPFSSGLLSFLPESDHYRFKGPASFVTWIIQGDTPSSGAGTTSTADLYVEFGLIGILVGMFLFGYFIRFAEFSFYAPGLPALFLHILSFVYLSDALYISRSSILFGFRTVVWIYVVLLINKFVFTRR